MMLISILVGTYVGLLVPKVGGAGGEAMAPFLMPCGFNTLLILVQADENGFVGRSCRSRRCSKLVPLMLGLPARM